MHLSTTAKKYHHTTLWNAFFVTDPFFVTFCIIHHAVLAFSQCQQIADPTCTHHALILGTQYTCCFFMPEIWYYHYITKGNCGNALDLGQDCWMATYQNKAIVDYTFPMLCTPVTPFPADPIYSKCGSDGISPCAAWCYWRSNGPFAANAL